MSERVVWSSRWAVQALVVLLLGLRQVLPPSVRAHDDAMLGEQRLSVLDIRLFANERQITTVRLSKQR